MKQKRFKKVVENNEDAIIFYWITGIGAIIGMLFWFLIGALIPMIYYETTIGYVPKLIEDLFIFQLIAFSIIGAIVGLIVAFKTWFNEDNRKVYWEEIK